ncbi:MAG TPA: hypothetical protein VGW39_02340 [Chthoniobacterales bacterium]|nr:hypothetical protein [Chthoniobacterales bacterium]
MTSPPKAGEFHRDLFLGHRIAGIRPWNIDARGMRFAGVESAKVLSRLHAHDVALKRSFPKFQPNRVTITTISMMNKVKVVANREFE